MDKYAALGVSNTQGRAMIQAAIAGLILLGLYKFIDRNRVPEDFDPKVDWWMAFVFVWAPSILIMFISIGISALSLSLNWVLLGYVLYFLVPFSILKFMLEFKPKRAVLYSIPVPIVATITEVIIVVMLGNSNA